MTTTNQTTTATTHDTVEEIVKSGKRRGATPLRRDFLQQKQGRRTVPGPLAEFVSASDRTALLLYLLGLTKASRKPWDVSLHASVWARALGFASPNGASARGRISKAWGRLVDRNLVTRSKTGRLAKFIFLCEDGSGRPYSRPTTQYIKVPFALWTDGIKQKRWFEILKLPEITFLIIGLSNKDGFSLPVERGPDYYGISADTLLRGAHGLRSHGLLDWDRASKKAPLAPEGYTVENRYTLQPPFGTKGKSDK